MALTHIDHLMAKKPKSATHPIRQVIQMRVTQAEQIEQQMLYETHLKTHRMKRSPKQKLTDACVNLLQYTTSQEHQCTNETRAAFIVLLSRTLEESSLEQINTQMFSASVRPYENKYPLE